MTFTSAKIGYTVNTCIICKIMFSNPYIIKYNNKQLKYLKKGKTIRKKQVASRKYYYMMIQVLLYDDTSITFMMIRVLLYDVTSITI